MYVGGYVCIYLDVYNISCSFFLSWFFVIQLVVCAHFNANLTSCFSLRWEAHVVLSSADYFVISLMVYTYFNATLTCWLSLPDEEHKECVSEAFHEYRSKSRKFRWKTSKNGLYASTYHCESQNSPAFLLFLFKSLVTISQANFTWAIVWCKLRVRLEFVWPRRY